MKRYKVDKGLLKYPFMAGIIQTLDRLNESDTLSRLPGNCISACDIVQNLLHFYGVPSKIVECQVVGIKRNQDMQDFCFIGFNNVGVNTNSIDTHVIVITETLPPVMIDASLGHLLDPHDQIIVRELTETSPDKIGEFPIGDVTFTYFNKKTIKLPSLHQKNMVQRIREDQEIKVKLDWFYKLIVLCAAFSLINFVANTVLIVLKMIYL